MSIRLLAEGETGQAGARRRGPVARAFPAFPAFPLPRRVRPDARTRPRPDGVGLLPTDQSDIIKGLGVHLARKPPCRRATKSPGPGICGRERLPCTAGWKEVKNGRPPPAPGWLPAPALRRRRERGPVSRHAGACTPAPDSTLEKRTPGRRVALKSPARPVPGP